MILLITYILLTFAQSQFVFYPQEGTILDNDLQSGQILNRHYDDQLIIHNFDPFYLAKAGLFPDSVIRNISFYAIGTPVRDQPAARINIKSVYGYHGVTISAASELSGTLVLTSTTNGSITVPAASVVANSWYTFNVPLSNWMFGNHGGSYLFFYSGDSTTSNTVFGTSDRNGIRVRSFYYQSFAYWSAIECAGASFPWIPSWMSSCTGLLNGMNSPYIRFGTAVPASRLDSSLVYSTSTTPSVTYTAPVAVTVTLRSGTGCLSTFAQTVDEANGFIQITPSRYLNNDDCQWVITTTNPRVELFFQSLDSEVGGSLGCYDYITLYDGGTTSASQLITVACTLGSIGSLDNWGKQGYVSTGNQLLLRWRTDIDTTASGFRVYFAAGWEYVWKYYQLTLPTTFKSLSIQTTSNSSVVLYMRKGSVPVFENSANGNFDQYQLSNSGTSATLNWITSSDGSGATAGTYFVGIWSPNRRYSISIAAVVPTPSISSVQPTGGSSGTVMTITGDSFTTTTGTVKIGTVNCPIDTWSMARVTCIIPAGEGTLLGVQVCTVHAGCVTSIAPNQFSYSPPTVLSINPNTADTNFQSSVVIGGSDFGLNPTVTIGGVNCPVTASTTTQITCTLPAGQGTSLAVRVTAAGQFGTNNLFSYRAPTVTSISPQLRNANGGVTITITGTNFGISNAVISATIGGITCSSPTLLTSHTQITCQLPAGGGTDRVVSVMVAGQTGSSSAGAGYNYELPVITTISPSTGNTSGGYPITINGAGFATSHVVQFRTSTNYLAITSRSTTQLIATMVAGIGSASISVNDSASVTFTYSPPTLSSLTPNNGPTGGSQTITIVGTNYGQPTDTPPTVRIGGQLCSYLSHNQSAILCSTPAGTGTLRTVQVAQSNANASADIYNYGPPTITSVTPSVASPGALITINGTNFGSSGATVTIGPYSITNPTISHTSIVATVPQGQGANHTVRVTQTGQTGSWNFFNFTAPRLTSISPTNMPTSSPTLLTIQGIDLGNGTSSTISVGSLSCNPSCGALCSWISTRIVCQLPAANGGVNLVTQVVSAGITSTNNQLFSFDRPQITTSGVTPLTGAAAGGYNLTFTGVSFGASTGTVTIGSRSCSPIFTWTHTSVICQVPAGVGNNNAIVLTNTFDSRAALESYTFAYNQPSISTIDTIGITTNGNFNITIRGQNFGTAASGGPPTVTLNLQQGEASLSASAACTIRSYNDTVIICAGLVGQGANIPLQVAIGGQTGANTITYPLPTVSSISFTRALTNGGDNLTILGSNFGITATVALGGVPCTNPSVTNHNTITCTIPAGSGTGLSVVVTVSGRDSVNPSITFSYDQATLTSITPLNGPTQGGIFVTITGQNLGATNNIVLIGGQTCTLQNYNGTLYNCTLPTGAGINRLVILYRIGVGNVNLTTNTLIYDYSRPFISSITPSSGFTQGGSNITINGGNFFSSTSASRYVAFTSSSCDSLSWSHTQIVCTIPIATTSPTASVLVYVDGQVNVNNITYSYLRPTFSQAVTSSGNSPLGSSILTIQGDSFGSGGGNVTINGRLCPPISWTHTQIQCTIPSGVGASLPIVITSNNGQTNIASGFATFSYAAPTITSIFPSTSITDGGGVLTIYGSNFGNSINYTATVRIGAKSCVIETPTDLTNNQIFCRIPSGQGLSSQNRISVEIPTGGQNANFAFAYGSPSIAAMTPTNGPTSGGINITLDGVNFGNGSEITLRLGSNTILNTNIYYISHQKIIFLLPTGVDGGYNVFLDVSGQNTTSSMSFTYDKPTISSVQASVSFCSPGPSGTVIDCALTASPRLLTIVGTNFGANGASQAITVDSVSCSSITYVNHTAVICSVPSFPSGGKNLAVQVTIGTQVSLPYVGVSFRTITIRTGSFQCITSYPPQSTCTTSGGGIQLSLWSNVTNSNVTLELIIDNLPVGTTLEDINLKFGLPGTFGNKQFTCPVTSFDSGTGTVRCLVRSGVGIGLKFMIASGGQVSVETVESVNFTKPSIIGNSLRFSLNPPTGAGSVTGTSSAGSVIYFDAQYISNQSENIKIYYYLTTLGSTIDDAECLNPRILNLITIECLIQPGNGGPYVFYIVAGTNSVSSPGTDTFNYPQAPVVFSISGCPLTVSAIGTGGCPTSGGGRTLTINGNYFVGTSATTVTIGNFFCSPVTYVNTTQLTCPVPSGTGTRLKVQVITRIATSTPIELISYNAPIITKILGCVSVSDDEIKNCPIQGNVNITLIGSDFGARNAVVLVGSTPCTDVVHDRTTPHQQLTCVLPPRQSQPQVRVILLQDNGLPSTNAVNLAYDTCPSGSVVIYNTTIGMLDCLACPVGRYTTDNLQIESISNPSVVTNLNNICVECPVGYHAETVGSTSCTPCSPGTYTDTPASPSCSPCPNGTYTNIDATVRCPYCPAGKYTNTSTTKILCQSCPIGFYSTYGSSSCLTCGVGQAAISTQPDGSEATSCTICPPGTFSGQNGTSQCVGCPIGTAAPFSQSVSCTDCVHGFFASRTGSSGCSHCNSGTFTNSSQSSFCYICPIGRYAATRAAIECLSCGNGKYQSETGGTTCVSCPPGKFTTSGLGCTDCPVGFFSGQSDTVNCERCGTGTFTNVAGATVCASCLPGFIPDDASASCVACTSGRFQPQVGGGSCQGCPVGTYTNLAGSITCISCLPGFFTANNFSVSCVGCNAGFFSPAGASNCTSCPLGRISTAASQRCTPCPDGTFSLLGTDCITCNPGQYLDQLTRTCLQCPLGRIRPTNQLQCTSCQPGYYANQAQSQCIACDPGFYQDTKEKTTCLGCLAGFFTAGSAAVSPIICPAGTFSVTNGTTCIACQSGTVQPTTAGTFCENCPAGKFASGTLQTKCTSCTPGYYNPSMNASTCLSCPSGTYQSNLDAVDCKNCPIGSSSLPGMSLCFNCEPGFFSPTDQSPCLPCPSGYFQSFSQQSTCEKCPSGTFSPDAAVSCINCPLGRFSGEGANNCSACEPGRATQRDIPGCADCPGGTFAPSGATSCYECLAGSFSHFGSSSCSPCLSGTYQPYRATNSCIPCEQGKISQEGQVECTPCSIGRYADAVGMTSCDLCQPGKSTPRQGSTECEPCKLGQAQNLPGQRLCYDCEAGTFSNQTGASSCLKCPSGTYSAAKIPNSVCTACPVGFYSATENTANCGECLPGFFTDVEGNSFCQKCPAGSAQSDKGRSHCDTCPIGKFSNLNASSICVSCPAGKFSNQTGLSACEDCPSGTRGGGAGLTECRKCDPGKFAEEKGSILCKDCPLGKFAPSFGYAACADCPAGQFRNFSINSVTCGLCPVGRASNITGLTECPLCGPGTFQNESGKIICLYCPVGKFQDVDGQEQCIDCPAGYYASLAGLKQCTPCPLGSYQNESGTIECISCPAGYYQNEIASKTCHECQAGRASPLTGIDRCPLCSAGRYQNTTSQIECLVCDKGYVQPDPGQQACIACESGKYMGDTNGKSCKPCDAGKYGNSSGLTECYICESGKYQPDAGMITCPDCFPGNFSLKGSTKCTSCREAVGGVAPTFGSPLCIGCDSNASPNPEQTRCLCDAGYYSPIDPRNDFVNFTQCKRCPSGAECPRGTYLTTLPTKSGWWRLNDSLQFYRCQQQSHCPGGVGYTCAENREGPLCAFCKPGYRTQTGQGGCAICPKRGASVGLIFVVALVVACVLFGLYYSILKGDEKLIEESVSYNKIKSRRGLRDVNFINVLEQSQQKQSNLRSQPDDNDTIDTSPQGSMGNFHHRRVQTNGSGVGSEVNNMENFDYDVDLPKSREQRILTPTGIKTKPNFTYKMKIFVGFFQVIGNFAFALNVPWPGYYLNFLNFLKVINLDFLRWASLDCVVKTNYFLKYLVFVTIPPALFITLFIVYFLPLYLLELRDLSDDDTVRARLATLRRKFLKLAIFTVFLIYPSVSSVILRLYVCQQVANVWYLVEDMTIQCYTTEWYSYAYGNIIAIFIFPIGIPLFFSILIWRQRHNLAKPSTRLQYGFLYDAYSEQAWWFDLVDMFNKLFMTSILAFFPVDAQIPIGMVWTASFTIAILLSNPYLRKGDDRLHLLGQTEIFMLEVLGYTLTQPRIEYSEATNIVLSMICIILTLLLPILFILQGFLFFKRLYYNFRAKRLHELDQREQGDGDSQQQLTTKSSAAPSHKRVKSMKGQPRDNFVKDNHENEPGSPGEE